MKSLKFILFAFAFILIAVIVFWKDVRDKLFIVKDKIMVAFKSNENNPFNIRANSANNWTGKTTKDGASFESFDTIEHGIRAGIKILKNYFSKYQLNTVTGIISRYAPDTENATLDYIKFVADKMTVNPNEKLTPDKDTLWALSEAICAMENGYKLKRDDFDKAWELV